MDQKLICVLPVIPMRKEPSDKSEMTNQVIYGETAIRLEENEKWMMVRLEHDNYEGWVDKKQLAEAPAKNESQPLRSKFAELSNGKIISCGSLVKKEDIISLSATAENLESFSQTFSGVPYLWGGRSFMGMDCSGFTQILLRIFGKSIPRDAWQQAEVGDTVTFVEESQSGDLAFFDNAEGRIIHVGIILNKDEQGRREIIHASGEVRVDLLDHQGIYNPVQGKYSHHLRLIKRL